MIMFYKLPYSFIFILLKIPLSSSKQPKLPRKLGEIEKQIGRNWSAISPNLFYSSYPTPHFKVTERLFRKHCYLYATVARHQLATQ